MDSSCSVVLIAAVTDTGDVGVKVAREERRHWLTEDSRAPLNAGLGYYCRASTSLMTPAGPAVPPSAATRRWATLGSKHVMQYRQHVHLRLAIDPRKPSKEP